MDGWIRLNLNHLQFLQILVANRRQIKMALVLRLIPNKPRINRAGTVELGCPMDDGTPIGENRELQIPRLTEVAP